jgi:hypothetical protein
MFEDHYIEWRKSRFEGIKKYMDTDFFRHKTLFEVGCGYGDNGKFFQNLGCQVTVSDSRVEHIEIAKIKNPHMQYEIFDCEIDELMKKYDILLHWGVLYHIDNVENHLTNICKHCDSLLLETLVCDTDISHIVKLTESGYDQAFHHNASRPSQKFVEDILTRNNFEFVMIKDSILNASFHIYDWEICNTLTHNHNLRRYWICWHKDIQSLIKDKFNNTKIVIDLNFSK